MDHRGIAILLVVGGLVAVVVGVLVGVGAFGWFGRLPGDVRWEGQRVRVFAPFGSMILISIVLTILLNLFLRR